MTEEEKAEEKASIEPQVLAPVAPVEQRLLLPMPLATFNAPPLDQLPPPQTVP